MFIPLRLLIPNPADLLGLVPLTSIDQLDAIGVTGIGAAETSDGTVLRASLATAPGHELTVSVPGFPDLALVLRDLASLEVLVSSNPAARIAVDTFVVRLPRQIFRPVAETAAGWQDTGGTAEVAVSMAGAVGPVSIEFDRTGFVRVVPPIDPSGAPIAVSADLTEPVMIGDTGLVITASGLGLTLDSDDPTISVTSARLLLPPGLAPTDVVLPELTFADAVVSWRGFSGTLTAEWDLTVVGGEVRYTGTDAADGGPRTVPASMFGLNGGLEQIAVRLTDSAPEALGMAGKLRLPFFDDVVDIELGVDGTGGLSVRVAGADDGALELTREGLFTMRVASLALAASADETAVTVSGSFRPAFFGSEGVGWPEIGVEGLRAGLRGGEPFVEIDGGWIELRDQAVLDLYGFRGELSRIGFGREDGRLWLGLSGSIQLVELLPAGAAVENARVLWDPNLDVTALSPAEIVAALSFELSGLAVQYTMPGVLEFSGSAYLIDEGTIRGFGGDLRLQLPTVGLGVAAGLLVGFNTEAPPYPFLFLSLDVDLPAGVPLGQSGLALKGAAGLVGYNVFPRRTEPQNWYEDWYKRGPEVGVLHSSKWAPLRDGLAFGAGVTITTVDGYVKGVRALLALLLPGPVILFEGRALFLAGLSPDAEPPLRMLAVIDGSEGTLQLNVEAQAELVPDAVRASGGLEGFFDVDDVTRWHVYLGQDEPADRRIRATVYDLFKASASLMLDNSSTQLAAGIEVSEEWRYQLVEDTVELAVSFDALIEGRARLNYRPEQIEGTLRLRALVGLTAPAVELGLSAAAELTARGPRPLVVDATVDISADLPWPLPDYETEFQLHWDEPIAPPVNAPLVAISVGNDRTEPDATASLHSVRLADGADPPRSALTPAAGRAAAEAARVVPLDAKVLLTFGVPVDDATGAFFRDTRAAHTWRDVGRFRLTTTVLDVAVYAHDASDGWTSDAGAPARQWDEANWRLAYRSTGGGSGGERLRGVWLADEELDDAPSGARRLRLWARDPFTRGGTDRLLSESGRELAVRYGGRSVDLGPPAATGTPALPVPPYAEGFLAGRPDYGRCRTDPAQRCIRFTGLADGLYPNGITVAGVRCSGAGIRVDADAVLADRIELVFPEPVVTVRLRYRTASTPDVATIMAHRPSAPAEHRSRLAAWRQASAADLARYQTLAALTNRSAAQRTDFAALSAKLRKHGEARPRWPSGPCEVHLPRPTVTVGADHTLEVRVAPGDPLRCLRIGKHTGALVEVCFTTVNAATTVAAQEAICATNRTAVADGAEQVLSTDTLYRVVVHSRVDVELRDLGLPAETPPAAAELVLELYQALVDATPAARFVQEGYFRSAGPPRDLAPYVRWTTPADRADAVWTDQDIAIGFTRGTLRAMFPGGDHALAVEVWDTNGVRIGGRRAATFVAPAPLSPLLAPEEELWFARLADAGTPLTPGGDDVLFAAGGGLHPRTRYQLRVVDTADPAYPLLTVGFVTSRFAGFTESLGPDPAWPDRPVTVPSAAVAGLDRSALRAVVGSAAAIRYQDGYLAECRLRGVGTLAEQGAARRARVDREAALDAGLAELGRSLGLADQLLAPPSTSFSVRRLVTDAGATVGLLFTAVEPIDWRETIRVSQGTGAPETDKIVGRVALTVRAGSTVIGGILVPSGDRTRAVYLFEPGTAVAAASFTLTFTHHGQADEPAAPLRRTGPADPFTERVVRMYN